jgi:hypothetical protein
MIFAKINTLTVVSHSSDLPVITLYHWGALRNEDDGNRQPNHYPVIIKDRPLSGINRSNNRIRPGLRAAVVSQARPYTARAGVIGWL